MTLAVQPHAVRQDCLGPRHLMDLTESVAGINVVTYLPTYPGGE